MEKLIYHILSRSDWEAQESELYYTSESLARQGFIHCSTKDQVIGVVSRLFHGRTDLILLEINESTLTASITYENLEGGETLFPHIYGKLNKSAILSVIAFPCLSDGNFKLPSAISNK